MITIKRFFLVFFCLSAIAAQAQLRVPKLVGNHMVLQQNQNLPLWGWAKKGETITVQFQGKSYKTKTGKDSKWKVQLPSHKAGGPYTLSVVGKKEQFNFTDVYVGEVWVASGQSNMEWKLSQPLNNNLEEIAAADYPLLRFINVDNTVAITPLDTISSTGWKICSPANAPGFSAIGYFFARGLHQQYKVPVGIIMSEWGGTPAEAWTREEVLKPMPEMQAQFAELEAQKKQLNAQGNYEKALEKWTQNFDIQDSGKYHRRPAWNTTATNTSNWKTMKLPGAWENHDATAHLNGIVYFRRDFELDVEPSDLSFKVMLGTIDDIDSVWINDKPVGGNFIYNRFRNYNVPSSTLKKGKNTIIVRVIDSGGDGGFTGSAEDMRLKYGSTYVPLSGPWKYAIANNKIIFLGQPPLNPKTQNRPGGLYNGMIAPLQPYAIKGAIWYQGETNARSEGHRDNYFTTFSSMIKDWRAQWGQGEFPFLFVQLASFNEAPDSASQFSDWARLREGQSNTLSVPKTGMATAIDIGDATNIHPYNKQDVGARLVLAARNVAYGEQVRWGGGMYDNHSVKGAEATITFKNTGGKLVSKSRFGYVNEFAVAGEDKQWHWAPATITSANTVSVKHPAGKEIKAIRYAFSNNPHELNLFTADGLPVLPFRTDRWEK